MGKNKKYSDEFKQEVLAMVAGGERSVSQIERDLDITPGLIYKWQQRYRVVEEKLQPSAERVEEAEIRRLKREVEITRQERDILKKPFEYSRGGSREALSVHSSSSPDVSGAADVRGAGGGLEWVLRLAEARTEPTTASK